jgi:hypothetical protein
MQYAMDSRYLKIGPLMGKERVPTMGSFTGLGDCLEEEAVGRGARKRRLRITASN